MKKVLQTIAGGITSEERGNCMQAVVASLFELELNEVPNFIELGEEWFMEMWDFYRERGYGLMCFDPKGDIELTKKVLAHDGGVNGYWDASVKSQTFDDGSTHAVVIDKDMNIVHDPNPNQRALKLKPEDILMVYTVKDDWHIFKGELIIE